MYWRLFRSQIMMLVSCEPLKRMSPTPQRQKMKPVCPASMWTQCSSGALWCAAGVVVPPGEVPGTGERQRVGETPLWGDRSLRCGGAAPLPMLPCACWLLSDWCILMLRRSLPDGETGLTLDAGSSGACRRARSARGTTSKCESFGMVGESTTVASPSRSSTSVPFGKPAALMIVFSICSTVAPGYHMTAFFLMPGCTEM
mmetsp:Transcript_37281/g.105254  ORF Transcript_37281/g.105254 Transcript_37281/m.105254 type:complete len:200 (-) Transcript_37281:264-863(-)